MQDDLNAEVLSRLLLQLTLSQIFLLGACFWIWRRWIGFRGLLSKSLAVTILLVHILFWSSQTIDLVEMENRVQGGVSFAWEMLILLEGAGLFAIVVVIVFSKLIINRFLTSNKSEGNKMNVD